MPTSAPEPLLAISGLSAGYGKIGVLRNIDLRIAPGESVALLGPNGAGKTTLLRAVSGLLPWSGQIRFGGKDMAGSGPRDTVRAGLVHVIEGHRVFTQLTVLDNLLLAGYGMARGERAALQGFTPCAHESADTMLPLPNTHDAQSPRIPAHPLTASPVVLSSRL